MRPSEIAALAGFGLLAGCATVSSPPALPEAQLLVDRNYTLGVEQTAIVGEAILSLKHYSVVTRNDALTFTENCRVWSTLNFTYDAPEGATLPVVGMRKCAERECFVVRLPVLLSNGAPANMQVGRDGKIVGPPINTLFNNFVIGDIKVDPQNCRLRPATEIHPPTDGSPYQNFEIIYSGIDDKAMRFTYREFTLDDHARPAFAQEFSYPVETRQVRFKAVAINVVSAKPTEIEYAVVSDGAPR